MAGLLEAEGHFASPPPSSPRSGRIVCQMTDEDVIERLAALWGSAVNTYQRKSTPHTNFRLVYMTKVTGYKASLIMHLLSPLMSARKQGDIERSCLIMDSGLASTYIFEDRAEQIRKLASEFKNESSLEVRNSAIAETLGIGRNTVYRALEEPLHPTAPWQVDGCLWDEQLAWHWAAGVFEGDGSAHARTIKLGMKDLDTVARFAGITGGSSPKKEPGRKVHWNPMFHTWVIGKHAVSSAEALYGNLGTRRKEQIQLHVLQKAPARTKGSVPFGDADPWQEHPIFNSARSKDLGVNLDDPVNREQFVRLVKFEINESSLSSRELAPKYGLSHVTISKIRNGKVWSDIEPLEILATRAL